MSLKSLLFLILVPIYFTGCGGGETENEAHEISKASGSQRCMDARCHGTMPSPVTKALIADEWRRSRHQEENAAGCADCHEPDAGHPKLCSKCHGGGGFAVTKNPDQAGNCGKCHAPSFPEDAMMALAPQHYGYDVAGLPPDSPRASYVSGEYRGRCRACHNPHDNTLTPQHRDWAKSLHGDARGAAWTHYDFKQDRFASCSRCHTATGFKSFVTSGFTVPTKGFGAGDQSHELLACDACHESYDFRKSIRRVPPFSAGYGNFNATGKALFPDGGRSNLCNPCHSGRESGQAINAIADFRDAGFVNSHYLAASGLMYMQIGFTGFTPPETPIGNSTYGRSLSPDSLTTPGGIEGGTSSTHRKLGTPLINGDRHNPAFFTAGVLDSNGPCVTCHMNASGVPGRPGSGHTLKIDGNAYAQVCTNCHGSEGGVALSPDNFRTVFLEPQAEVFRTALELLRQLLVTKYRISFDESRNPYFFDEDLPLLDGKKQPVRDWTRGGTVDGRRLMGACFNLNLLAHDHAAYAHARTYTRRLIYDSVDFLDDGAMNLSVSGTAAGSGLTLDDGVTPAYGKDVKAYNAPDGDGSLYGTTTEAMLYLATASRSTGKWNEVERP